MEVDLPGRTQMDKVCDTCGVSGYAESLQTCSLCKKTSRHIYCMESEPGSEVWDCDECLGSLDAEVVHATYMNQKIAGNSNAERTKNNFLLKERLRLAYSRSSQQANVDKRVLCGLEKRSFKHDVSHIMPKICKTKRSSAAYSHSKAVETGKVKFISADEAAMLTTKAKSRVYGARGSFQTMLASDAKRKTRNVHADKCVMLKPETKAMSCNTPGDRHLLLHQAANTVPSISEKPYDMSVGAGLKTLQPLSRPKCATNVEKPRPYISECSMVMKCKEGKMKNNKASGKEAFVPLCINETVEGSVKGLEHEYEARLLSSNEKLIRNTAVEKVATTMPTMEKFVEEYVNAGVLESSSERVRYLESKWDTNGAPPDRYGEDSVAGLHTEFGSEVGLTKACVPDKILNDLHNDMDVNCPSSSGSGIIAHSDARLKSSVSQDPNRLSTVLMNPEVKIRWKGTFDISAADFDVCCEIQGFVAPQVSYKAYECSKLMPGKLKLKVIPRLSVWPKTFQLDPPFNDDVGVYFLPSEIERSEQIYAGVIKHMDFSDYALQSCVANVELLIYTSNQLPVDNQRLPAQKFLWGIFRHMRPKKRCENMEALPFYNPVQMKKIQADHSKNQPESKVIDANPDRAPPAFLKPVSSSAAHGKKTLVIAAPKNAASRELSLSRKETGLASHQASGEGRDRGAG